MSARPCIVIPAFNEEARLPAVLAELRRTLPDHDLVVIECEIPPPPASPDRVTDLGQRLWALEREATRASLRRSGASVATWPRGSPLGPLLQAVIRERRRPHRVGAG